LTLIVGSVHGDDENTEDDPSKKVETIAAKYSPGSLISGEQETISSLPQDLKYR
jgi:hypothetical protein